MEPPSSVDSSRPAGWPAAEGRDAADRQWPSVYDAGRLLVADVAQGVRAVANGLWVFPGLPTQRGVAEDARGSAGEGTTQGGQKTYTECRNSGQSEREDHGKRGRRGYDAGKKILGRKRHLLVDTLGLILVAVVHAGDIQDRDGARLVLDRLGQRFGRLRLIWADGGYAGQLVAWVQKTYHRTLEIVKRSDDLTGFVVLPKRWIVERTFSWLYRYRRLSKDYEQLPENSEAMILIAMINLMSRRLAHGCVKQDF